MKFTIETRTFRSLKWLIVALLLVGLSSGSPALAASGKIVGKVVDSESGEGLIGVTVMLEGTTTGTRSNLEGDYAITKIPSGTYTLIFSTIGYGSKRVEEVVVKDGETQTFNMALETKIIEGKVVTVQASRIKGTEVSLLADRSKAIAVSDAISSETMSRTGSADAGEAVTKVPGASVMGGKFVVVRGLGGRYSNTTLNGASIPNADPDQHSVHMDLLPAKLLDKVVIKKTFTPDQSGDFAGGSVDIGTKSMPDDLTISFSQSSGMNTESTGKSGFLTYKGGNTDWLAIDDGTRDLPDVLADPATVIPRYSQARTNRELAHQLDEMTNSFNNVMAPTTKKGPIDQSYAFSYGNRYSLNERPLGVVASLTYSHKARFYEDGQRNRWERPGTTEYMNPYYLFNDSKGSEEILWGGLAGLSFEPSKHHKLSADFMYTRNSESTARYLDGLFVYEFPGNDRIFESRALKFSERYLQSLQLSGKHLFISEDSYTLPFELAWQASYSENNANTPDFRTFADAIVYEDSTLTDTIGFVIQSSGVDYPARWFGEMQERRKSIKVDFSHELSSDPGYNGKFKAGVFAEQTRRENRERRINYTTPATTSAKYWGDPFDYFSPANSGITDSSFWKTQQVYNIDTLSLGDGTYSYDTTGSYTDSLYRYSFGNVVVYNLEQMRKANYDGYQNLYATYGMVEIPVSRKLQVIVGGRVELTEMRVVNSDGDRGGLNDIDILPSANIIYRLSENMNFRLAATRTLARPIFREKVLLSTHEFNYGYKFVGNPDLERTLISNYDIRWEYFMRPGEIFAVSGYYKYFDRPITRFIVNINYDLEPRNVDYGKIHGLEIEFRGRLDRIAGWLSNFTIGGNLSILKSEIRVGDEELQIARASDPNWSPTRTMEGQSDYLINLDLGYESRRSGTTIDVMYNVFGERMTEVSLGAAPDVFEQPFHSLKAKISQRIIGKLNLSLSASNILNESYRTTQTLGGTVYTDSEYRLGRTFSIGTSFSF